MDLEIKKEVVKIEQDIITQEKIIDYLDTFGLSKKLNDKEKKQFIDIALAYRLNPLKREIYCVPHVDKNGNKTLSIYVGYEVYLKRAERTGKLAGWDTEIIKENNELRATITIYRKDWSHPLRHSVYFKEYDQHRNLWISKPRTMLRKVAIAQGFRLAFPDELGGMPYTGDELPEQEAIEIQPEKKGPTKTVENEINKLKKQIDFQLGQMADGLPVWNLSDQTGWKNIFKILFVDNNIEEAQKKYNELVELTSKRIEKIKEQNRCQDAT